MGAEPSRFLFVEAAFENGRYRLRFVDDILLLATSAEEIAFLFHEFLKSLSQFILILNGNKTKMLTTRAQPPKTIWRNGYVIDKDGFHKWLGTCCQGAMEVTNWILNNITSSFKAVSFVKCVIPFRKIMTLVACLAAGHGSWMFTSAAYVVPSFARQAKNFGRFPGTKSYTNGMLM